MTNLRKLKNFTQAYMADILGMSVSGYGKIERNETEITLTRLKQIAEILEVEYSKILDFDKNTVFNIYNNENASGIVQNQQGGNAISNVHSISNDEIYQKLIKQMESEIDFLRSKISSNNTV